MKKIHPKDYRKLFNTLKALFTLKRENKKTQNSYKKVLRQEKVVQECIENSKKLLK